MQIDIDVFPLEKSPGRRLRQAHLVLHAGLTRRFADEGCELTVEQWAVLSQLHDSEAVSQSELARLLPKSEGSVSRVLALLERRHLVERPRAEADLRRSEVALTERGRQVRSELAAVVRAYLQSAFRGVTPQEYEGFMRVTRKVCANAAGITEQSDGEPWDGA